MKAINDKPEINVKSTNFDIIDIKSSEEKKEVYKEYQSYKPLTVISPIQEGMISNLSMELTDNDPKLATEQVTKIMNSITEGYAKIDKLGENVVLVLGKTGVGKSTLINYLGGVKLVGYDDNDEIKIKALGDAIAPIGGSSLSETGVPARCESKGYIFWDCPGFEDNRGADQDIINAFYITHIVKQSDKVSMCALLHYDVTKGKANGLIEFVDQIDRLFARNKDVYEKSLTIMVTHVPEKGKSETIQKKLMQMLDEANIKNKETFKNIISTRLSIFKEPSEGGSVEFDYGKLLENLGSLKPIEVKNGVQVCPSISAKSALAAMSLYSDLNQTITSDLKRTTSSILEQYNKLINDQSTSKEKLQDALNIFDKVSKVLPNVITVDQLGIVFESGKKHFDTYTDKFGGIDINKQYVVSSLDDTLESRSLTERLNAVKFLENIVLDYARFKPVNLYELLKEPMIELKNKIQIKLGGEIPKEELGVQEENKLKANDEYKEAEGVYEERKGLSTGTKVGITAGTVVVGGMLGGGMVLGSMEVGATFGAAGGPLGIAIGAGVGLVVGGLIALFS